MCLGKRGVSDPCASSWNKPESLVGKAVEKVSIYCISRSKTQNYNISIKVIRLRLGKYKAVRQAKGLLYFRAFFRQRMG